MSFVKQFVDSGLSEDNRCLVTELERLLQNDSTNRSAAAFVLTLVAEGRITAESARSIYGEAICRVYFRDKK